MPPSFTYERTTDASDSSRDPGEKFFLSLVPTAQMVGRVVIPAATGTVAVTGLGFQPDVIVLMGQEKSGSASAPCRATVGAASATAEWAYGTNIRHGTDPSNQCSWRPDACVSVINGVAVEMIRANLDSLDADGFTLDVTINALGRTFTLAWLALQGDFKVGIGEVPIVDGTQELSASFMPKAAWFSCGGNFLTGTRGGWDSMNGIVSNGGEEHAVWGGARASGAPNQAASRWDNERCFSLHLAFKGSSPASTRAAARVDAWLANSVRLDWFETDGNPYQYGYLLAAEGEVDSFTVNTSDPVAGVVVPTTIEPLAMISLATGYFLFTSGTQTMVPLTYYYPGIAHLSFGASPWTTDGQEEQSLGYAQSSGGPGGGGFPTCKCFLNGAEQGRAWTLLGTSGQVVNTGAGLAFDIIESEPEIVRQPGLNWRSADRHLSAARLLRPTP